MGSDEVHGALVDNRESSETGVAVVPPPVVLRFKGYPSHSGQGGEEGFGIVEEMQVLTSLGVRV